MPHGSLARNIELKVRLPSLAPARAVAQQLQKGYLGFEHQTDSYFYVNEGRLKLREIEGKQSQLVWYARQNTSEPRPSDYRLVPVEDAAGLKAALDSALGIWGVVQKRREIFLVENVRVHLDEVAGLGTFLELEAVVGPDADEAVSRERLDRLCRELGVDPSQSVPVSYSDLLLLT